MGLIAWLKNLPVCSPAGMILHQNLTSRGNSDESKYFADIVLIVGEITVSKRTAGSE
jgi:hypothetical protein